MSENSQGLPGLENIITQTELAGLLGVKTSQIDHLRRTKQLPFVDVARGSRVFFIEDVLLWFKAHRKTLNLSE